MSLTRKALIAAAKKPSKPRRQDLAAALAACEAELAEARRQQIATADVLKVISRSAFDLDAVLKTLTESAHALSGAATATVFLHDGEALRIRAESGVAPEFLEYLVANPIPPGRETVTGRVLMTGETVLVPDVLADPDYNYGAGPRLGNYRALLGVPLIRDGKVEGVFGLQGREPGAFTQRQIELVRTFADQAVIAINNVGLFNETQEALRQQTATADILKVIASSPNNLQPVLDKIVETACRLCNAYDAVVLLREGDRLRAAAHHGPIPLTFASQAISRGLLAGRAVIERRAIHIDDIAKHADEYPVATALASQGAAAAGSGKMAWRANLVMPLMREGEAVGVIGLRRAEPEAFSESQIELLKTFADQAVIAIENVRLFDEVQAKTRDLEEALEQQTASAEILSVISSSPTDVRPVFESIVRTARKLCDAERASVHILRDGAYHAIAVVGRRETGHDDRLADHPILPGRGSITGRVAEERSVVHVHDVAADPEFTFLREDGFEFRRTMLGVPLLRDGRVIGVIALQRSVVQPFTKTHIDLITTFADQAVIAIENARLFDEVQARTRELEESLQQQTATANVLKVISRSAFDLQAVFDTLIASAVELSGSHSGAICVRDGEIFRYRSSSGPGASAELHNYLVEHPANPGRGSIVGRAVLSRQIEQIPDIREDWEYSVPISTHGNPARALVGVPLLGKDRVEGAIVLTRLEPGAFPERQIEILQTFADQAVIAIENARLFDEVQAKTRDLEESLQQQTATADVLKVISRSAFDLQTVLDTLAASAAALIGASFAVMNLKRGDVIRPEATFGSTPELVEFLAKTPQTPGRRTVAGRVFMSGEVQNIRDVLDDPEYDFGDAPQLGNFRALLGVPLFRDHKVEGSFTLGREQPGAFTQRQIEIVQTFADQAVIAIENVRLFDEVQARTRDLEESLAQQTATADVLKVISRSAFNLQAVLDTLVASAAKLCDADQAGVFQRRGDLYHWAANYGYSPELTAYAQTHPFAPGPGSTTARVALEGRTIHNPDVLADPNYTAGEYQRLGNYRTNLGVPLLRGGAPIGVFILTRHKVRPFTERQIELVETFADQAVIAIENSRLFDEVQAKTRDLEESLQQQTATADVLKVISRSAFDLQAVLRTLVESAARLCGADKATITREINGVYYRAESYGFSDEFMDQIRNVPVAPERGSITGLAMLEGKAIQVEDVEADPQYWPKTFAKPGELRTGLGIPMMRNGVPIGVLALMRTEVRPFNAKQIELVQTFADQAVIAIENARLFDEVRARTRDLEESLRQQTATADVLKVISRSAFDLDAVFDALLTSAVSLIGSRGGTICVREGDGFKYRAVAEGRDSAMWRYLSENPPTPGRASVAGRILLSGRPEIITDSLLDNDLKVPVHALAGSRSIAGVPLLRNDRVDGALMVGRADAGPFDSRQIELLQTFADQAVIAIENVRLFDEVQARTRDLSEALTQQTATADVLKAISRSAFDLDTVLGTLIATAVRLCDATRGGQIFRRHGEVYRYAASRMDVDPAYLHHEREAEIAAGRGTLIGRVALENRAVQIVDAWNDPEYAEKDEARVGNVRAMLGAPLMRDGEMIGAFALARADPIPFSQRQVDLVATFADQAVIAIENVRLFDEVQAKTRDLEESLQQQTATANVLKVISRSAFDLQAVLTTLAESARDLCGASFVTLSLREGDAMRLRAESGCTPEIVQFMVAHPIRAGRETFTGRVMLSGEAMHVPDVFADPEYDFGEGPRIGNYRALLAVPLLRDGQVEGVFALARPEPAPFTERQIEMVRAFADQAVIAIENSRLFEEVQARTQELAASLDDLRKAQDRLIQSEKLASLGQLTAGIAHEIKNPLNFINNFSALSRELISELAEAIKGGAVNEATNSEVDELIGAIDGNLAKIVQHGKRADSIVKNMLLHSREGSGERSTTNVNAMVEEALNLAYHGARAEKPGFNVTIAKSLDPNAGFAEVYAQEITRVLLNLISNGFYATSRRRQSTGDGAYEPTIGASTRDLGPMVEIAIRDNGTGIPDDVKAKMFNPFFTTKPAGEGTGLGLSLSHDIVVKQHGGAIEVLTEPDAFTQFTIVLPRGAVQR